MTNQMVTFTYENTTPIRTMVDDQGEPLFCLADVCKVLELNDPSNTTRQLKEEFSTPVLNTGMVTRPDGSSIEATFITEPQLYFVMMRSRSDKAKPFRQWVVNEVLPSIRKTGQYHVEQPLISYSLEDKIKSTAFILQIVGIKENQLALALDKVVKAETGKSALKLTGVQLEAPQQEHLANPTQLGRQVGLSAIKINKILAEAGLQYKNPNDEWTPTKEGLDAGAVLLDVGKAHSDGTPVRQLKWPYSIIEVINDYL